MWTASLDHQGRVTLPRAVRDALGAGPGTELEFTIQSDGAARIRRIPRDARDGIGLLSHLVPPDTPPPTVEELDESIARHVADDDARIQRGETAED